MKKMNMLYEGKAKKIFTTDNSDEVIVEYKDDATAFDGKKKGSIINKGVVNNTISSIIFNLLSKNNISNHFIEKLSDREQLCKKVEIIPVEVIVRNICAGSICKRMGIEEGRKLNEPIFELSYKDDNLGDPFINDSYAISLELVEKSDLMFIYEQTAKINNIMKEFFLKTGVILVDFKLEFGKYKNKVLLADEISPDTCRFWEKDTLKKLDKDRFRRDLGNVEDAYNEMLNRISSVE